MLPLVAGVALLVLGVVLWLSTGETVYGLVSGAGVLVLLRVLGPWWEARSNARADAAAADDR